MAHLQELFEDAYALAHDFTAEKHRGQIRKSSGHPYVEHPTTVAGILDAYGVTDDAVLTASFCHDTLEDTNASWSELSSLFGERVADLVSELTNDSSAIKRLGKEEYMSRHMLELSKDALTIKLADCVHNALDKPKPGQYERMSNNLRFLKKHRKLTPVQKDLIEAFESAGVIQS